MLSKQKVLFCSKQKVDFTIKTGGLCGKNEVIMQSRGGGGL